MPGERNQVSLTAWLVSGALLLVSQALFVWMFLATTALEELARHGQVTGPPEWDALAETCKFTADWRHGMAGNSLVYMPGFFATGLATWLWSRPSASRRWFHLVAGGAVLLSATLVAVLLAATGSAHVAAEFAAQTGLAVTGTLPGPGRATVVRAVMTLLAWTSVVLCSRSALARRSLRPLAIPAALYLLLALLRQPGADQLPLLWLHELRHGDATALVSLLAIPGLLGLLVADHLASRRAAGKNASQVQAGQGPQARNEAPVSKSEGRPGCEG